MKKRFAKLMLALATAVCLAVTAFACGETKYKINFIVDGTVYDSFVLQEGTEIKIPADPTKEGCLFEGWYLDDGTYDTLFDAKSKDYASEKKDVNVYAKWHVHTFESEWSYDEDYHWKEATCGHDTVGNKGAHVFKETVIEPDFYNDGYTLHECTSCDYSYMDEFTDALDNTKAELKDYGDFELNGDLLEIAVSNSASSFDFENAFAVSNYATWTVTRDYDGNEPIDSLTLEEGYNAAYLRITSGDENTENVFYISIYRKHSYDVKFYGNGTILDAISVYGIEEGETLSAPEIAKNGYVTRFDCSFPLEVYGNYEINVYFDPISYAINYVLNGGDNGINNPSAYTIEDEITLTAPEKRGYTGSWNEGNVIQSGTTGELTFTAVYTPVTYQINYNLNGGSNSADNPSTFTVEDEITLKSPEKFGYTFSGWSGFSDSGVIPKGTAAEVTFTANFTPIEYDVIYVLNGGSNDLSNPSKYTIETSLTLAAPLKTGYSGSWNDGGVIAGGTTGDLTFTASYARIDYNIEYVLGGGMNDSRNPATYNYESGDIALYPATHSNGIFLGWILNGVTVTEIKGGTTGNLTLTADWELSDVILALKDDNTYKVTGLRNKTATEVTVPDSFGDTPITEIDAKAFQYCSLLKDITIGNNVSSIGEYAFQYCSGSGKLTFGNSVKTIEKGAFNNGNFRDVYYTGTMKDWLSIEFKDSVAVGSTADSNPLYGGGSLYIGGKIVTEIDLPEDVTEIPKAAFIGCGSIVSLKVGPNLVKIGNAAFYRCPNLENLYWDNEGCEIWRYGLDSCPKLANLYIDKTVNQLAATAYNSDAWNPLYYVTNLYLNGSSEPVTELVIDTPTIGEYAFSSFKGCTSLVIGENVTTIGAYSFYNCINLETVDFNSANCADLQFYNCAFDGCSALQNLRVGENVKRIPAYLFERGPALINISLPDGIESIGEKAFITNRLSFYSYGNALYLGNDVHNYLVLVKAVSTDISECTVADTARIIMDEAFNNCTALTELVVPDGVINIAAGILYGCTAIQRLTLPEIKDVESSGRALRYVFNVSDNSRLPASLTTVTRTGITKVYNSSFSGSRYITTVILPDTVTEIETYAFNECTALTSVNIPDGVKSIGMRAFTSTKIKEIVIPDSVETIDQYAFSYCGKLTRVTVGKNVKSIGSMAFVYCYSLIEIYNRSALEINAGLNTNGYVANYAKRVYDGNQMNSYVTFGDDGYVDYNDGTNVILVAYWGTETEIDIPDKYTEIYAYAFGANTAITSVTIGANITKIGKSAFYSCRNLATAYFDVTEGWIYSPVQGSNTLDNTLLEDPATAASKVLKAYFASKYDIELIAE